MAKKRCKLLNCNRPIDEKGYCEKHFMEKEKEIIGIEGIHYE